MTGEFVPALLVSDCGEPLVSGLLGEPVSVAIGPVGPIVTVTVMVTGELIGEPLPGEPLPGELLPGELLPGELLPGVLLPGELLPGKLLPGELLPGELLPGELLPGELLPGELDSLPGDEPYTGVRPVVSAGAPIPGAFVVRHAQASVKVAA